MTGKERRRSCNWLESVFVTANVRFIAGMSLKTAKPTSTVVAAVQRALGCIDGVRIASLDPVALECSGPAPPVGTAARNGRTLRQLVDDSAGTDTPVIGGPIVTVYEDVSDRGATAAPTYSSAVVVNTNHALMDAAAMKRISGLVSSVLEGGHVDCDNGDNSDTVLRAIEWYAAVGEENNKDSEIWKIVESNDGLPFLSWDDRTVPLKPSECLGRDESTDDPNVDPTPEYNDVVVTLTAEQLHKGLATARAGNTTWTGLWMACLGRSMAEAHFAVLSSTDTIADNASAVSSQSCSIAFSTLVDLRRFLPRDRQNLLQVQSTVTVAELWKADVAPTRDNLLEAAKAMTDQLGSRIQRGEAHRQAKAFSTGNLSTEAAPVEATIELSNHGVYPCTDVELSQRFDGYKGLSVIVHSVSGDGTMKATASFGTNLDPEKCRSLLERAVDLLALVLA